MNFEKFEICIVFGCGKYLEVRFSIFLRSIHILLKSTLTRQWSTANIGQVYTVQTRFTQLIEIKAVAITEVVALTGLNIFEQKLISKWLCFHRFLKQKQIVICTYVYTFFNQKTKSHI